MVAHAFNLSICVHPVESRGTSNYSGAIYLLTETGSLTDLALATEGKLAGSPTILPVFISAVLRFIYLQLKTGYFRWVPGIIFSELSPWPTLDNFNKSKYSGWA